MPKKKNSKWKVAAMLASRTASDLLEGLGREGEPSPAMRLLVADQLADTARRLEAVALYEAGASARVVARRTNMSHQSVFNLLRSLGVQIRQPGEVGVLKESG